MLTFLYLLNLNRPTIPAGDDVDIRVLPVPLPCLPLHLATGRFGELQLLLCHHFGVGFGWRHVGARRHVGLGTRALGEREDADPNPRTAATGVSRRCRRRRRRRRLSRDCNICGRHAGRKSVGRGRQATKTNRCTSINVMHVARSNGPSLSSTMAALFCGHDVHADLNRTGDFLAHDTSCFTAEPAVALRVDLASPW